MANLEHKIQMTEERAKKLKSLIDATGEPELGVEGGVNSYAPEYITTKIKWEAAVPNYDTVPFSELYKDENWTASKIYEVFVTEGIVILRKVGDDYPAISSGTLLNRSTLYQATEDFIDVRTSREISFTLAKSATLTSDIRYSKDDIVTRDCNYVDLETGTIVDGNYPLPKDNKHYTNFATVLCSVVVVPSETEGGDNLHLCMIKQNCNTICAKKENDMINVLRGMPTNTIIFGNGFYFDGTTLPKIKYKPTINIKESSSSSTKIDYEDDKIMFGDEFYLEDGYVRSTGGGGQGGTPETITYLNTAASVVSNNFHPKNLTVSVNNNGYLVISFDKETITQVTKTVLVPSSGS